MRTSLKFAKGTAVSVNGISEVKILIPGDPTIGEGRWVAGGTGWFENPEHGDSLIVEIQLADGTVVGSYADADVDGSNSGWYIPKHIGHIEVKALDLLGFIPASLYLVVRGTRAAGASEDVFWFNVNWGKEE